MRIGRNDIVEVIAGDDKGKQGRVLRVIRPSEKSKKGGNPILQERNTRVVVEKVRLVKRHRRQVQGQASGGIVEVEAPIHISNVKLVTRSSDRSSKKAD